MKVFVFIYLCFIVTVFLVTIKDFDSVADTPKEIYEITIFMVVTKMEFLSGLIVNLSLHMKIRFIKRSEKRSKIVIYTYSHLCITANFLLTRLIVMQKSYMTL